MPDWIANNPTLMIAAFAVVVIVTLAIFIVARIAGNNKKKAALAGENVAEIAFNAPVFGARNAVTRAGLQGYEVFSVNGAPPRIIGSSLLVPAGTVHIDMQYMITKVSGKRSMVFERQTVTYDVQRGKKYSVEYDILTHTFEFKDA